MWHPRATLFVGAITNLDKPELDSDNYPSSLSYTLISSLFSLCPKVCVGLCLFFVVGRHLPSGTNMHESNSSVKAHNNIPFFIYNYPLLNLTLMDGV